MKPDLLAQTPCAGYVILHPICADYVEVHYQEPSTEAQKDRARDWLLSEGFIGFASQLIVLDPEVSKYLESI